MMPHRRGNFVDLVEFAKHLDGSAMLTNPGGVVARGRGKPKERSHSQQRHNIAWAAASAAWNGLMADEKATWQEKAKALGYKAGYRLWLSAWFAQRIQSPSKPLLPI